MAAAAALSFGQLAVQIPASADGNAVTAAACPSGQFAGYEANDIALCAHADLVAAPSVAAIPQALPGIPCYPSTGPAVHVYYAYEKGKPNRLAAQRAQIRDLVAQTDAIYAASARDTGGTRHVRWLMSGSCQLIVTPLVVPVSTNTYAPMTAVTQSHTLRPTDHAVIFLDWNGPAFVCGYGSRLTDPRPGAVNQSNRYQGMAEIYAYQECRHDGTAVAHELGHTLGAVQEQAPHASYNGHCYDGAADVMCYDDGTIPAPMRAGVCPEGAAATFDCGHDDYYNAKPVAGSYLTTHWNVANSVLLARSGPARWDRVPNPTVTLTNVIEGQTLDSADTTPVTVAVVPAGGVVASVQFYEDLAAFNGALTVAPYDGSPRGYFAGGTNGPHRLYARLTMTNGVTRTSPVVTYNVADGDPAPPAVAPGVAKLTLKAGSILHASGSATFAFTLTHAGGQPQTVQVITKSGWMHPVSVKASARSITTRVNWYSHGSDSVWLRIYLSDGTSLFTNHVAVSWG